MSSMSSQHPVRGLVALMATAAVAASFGQSAGAATQTIPASADTFINSLSPDNNNGATLSLFTGREGRGGMMRGLIRFDLPAALAGRVAVTNSLMSLTTQADNRNQPPAAATLAVHPLSVGWSEGNGAGNSVGTFVVGQTCTGTGATWNRPQCTTGTWPAPATPSASATVPAITGAVVTWSSAAMNADVQQWIDTPSSYNGWLITSSTEAGSNAQIQRFASSEAATGFPSLAITYSCKAGFGASGNACTTCTAAANGACAITQSGNACVDTGPPSTAYACTCGAAGFTPGTGPDGKPACLGPGGLPLVTLDIDGNGSYDALTDGLLVIRYLFSIRGAPLIANAIGAEATRTTADLIETRMAQVLSALDVDLNGSTDALSDGLMILRYLFTLRGDAVTVNAIASNAQRDTAQINAYIQSLTP